MSIASEANNAAHTGLRGSSAWCELQDIKWDRFSPKHEEYGSQDLRWMTDALTQMGVAPVTAPGELACFTYLLGKVARAVAAYGHGKQPSEDTLIDLAIYADMMLLARGGTL